MTGDKSQTDKNFRQATSPNRDTRASVVSLGERLRSPDVICERDRSPAPQLDVKPLKGLNSSYEPRKRHDNCKKIYYNPLTTDHEVVIKNRDMPELRPLWAKDKGSPKRQIFNYLNNQNLRLAYEVEHSTCKPPITDW